MSILYKYHISRLASGRRSNEILLTCRSFISIIFPFNKGRNTELRIVSILYKYHIFQKAFDKKEENVTVVSILYKYHISLQNTTMKKQPSSSCRSFISIIFPLLNIAHFGLWLIKILKNSWFWHIFFDHLLFFDYFLCLNQLEFGWWSKI